MKQMKTIDLAQFFPTFNTTYIQKSFIILYIGIHCSQMTQHYRKTHLDYKTQGTLLHESTWYRQGFHGNFFVKIMYIASKGL